MPTSLLVIARGVEIGASLLVAGIFTFEIVVAQAGRQAAATANPAERRLLRLALWGLAVAFLAALLWFAFEVANMSGLPLTRAFSGGSWETVLSATRFGHVWALRLGLIAVCLALVALRVRCRLEHAALRFALWLFSLAFLVSLAWISHAAAAGVQPFGLLNDALHLYAAAAWLGGLPCLAIYLTTTPPAAATPILQRFSTLSLCCVSVLVLSGIANAWLLVGSFPALFTTRYGALLLFKLALFAILLGFGARNRLLVKANSHSTDALPDLLAQVRRNLRWEIGLGLGVVAVVGWLGATPPPHPAHSQAHGNLDGAATRLVDLGARFSLCDTWFDGADERENHPGEHDAEEREANSAQPCGGAHRGRHSDARRRCQSLDLAFGALFQNGTCTDKANAGGETLDDSRQITHRHPSGRAVQNEKCAAHGDQHMSPQAGGLSRSLTLKSDDRAYDHGSDHPDDYPLKPGPVWNPAG